MVLVVKNQPTNAGDIRYVGSILGFGRSPGGGNGNPFQYSCLKKSHGQRSLAGYSLWCHKELNTILKAEQQQIQMIKEKLQLDSGFADNCLCNKNVFSAYYVSWAQGKLVNSTDLKSSTGKSNLISLVV